MLQVNFAVETQAGLKLGHDLGAAGDDGDRAVLVHMHRAGGLAADVEPEAGGDAAALVRPERSRVVRMRLGDFQGRDVADVLPVKM